MTELQLTTPDDWHLHLRDGALLNETVPATARAFSRAVVMPNLVPPVLDAAAALAYRQRIEAARPEGSTFTPLMTLYLTDLTTPEMIRTAHSSGVTAVKLYPAGATTHSDQAVTSLPALAPVLETLSEIGMPLLVHGEVTDPAVDVFDREAVFIDTILQPELYPELYKNIYHKVRINYYPPRKDNKEGWDNIDLVGWMGYPMQLKVDFLCRDSILAAPLCLDLVLFADLALRCNFSGIQSWLSFYFKSPMHDFEHVPEHDLFIQYIKLKNTLRTIIGEETLDYID